MKILAPSICCPDEKRRQAKLSQNAVKSRTPDLSLLLFTPMQVPVQRRPYSDTEG
jgi:hypothetical protein